MTAHGLLNSIKSRIPRPVKAYIKRRLAFIIPQWRFFTPVDQYASWFERTRVHDKDIPFLQNECSRLSYTPTISFITPVYNTKRSYLIAGIESVLKQVYPHWELCIVNDGSTNEYVRTELDRFAQADSRIRVHHADANKKIVAATNRAIELATGEFIMIFDSDDLLEPDALYEIVRLLNKHPKADLIYSDEDRPLRDLNNKYIDYFFKPDWSPDLLHSTMYIPHCILRRSIVNELGGMDSRYTVVAHDFDLVMRFTEQVPRDHIYHIPKVLYHWREHSEKDAISMLPDILEKTNRDALAALDGYLQRNSIPGKAEVGTMTNFWRVRYDILGRPIVSIIIPTKNRGDLLQACIRSIQAETTYQQYEIIVINNQSDDLSTLQYLQELKEDQKIRVIDYPHPFNYSAINNFGVTQSLGEYILFLNVDTEVMNGEWLTAMLEHAQRESVGAVGAKLLYPNRTIQHAGVILGWEHNGVAGHAFAGEPEKSVGYHGFADCVRNVSAITAACMLIRKRLFLEMGGFNERELKIIFNDTDLCLRLLKAGFDNVYTPYATLLHHETAVRQEETNDQLEPFAYMKKTWGKLISADPYYNKNLSLGQLFTLK